MSADEATGSTVTLDIARPHTDRAQRSALACVLLAASLVLAGPAQARRLPADQLVEHLLSVAEREWRDWGQPLVDTLDGSSRMPRAGAHENDRAWRPSVACTATMRRARTAGCHHRAPFDAHERVRRYWAEGLGPDSKPARDPVELDRVARTQPWSAAFISFLMEQVGLSREAFPFDDTHSNYLRGIAERAQPDGATANSTIPIGSTDSTDSTEAKPVNESDEPNGSSRSSARSAAAAPPLDVAAPVAEHAQFVLRLVGDTPLAPGDLICGPRNISRDRELLTLQRMKRLEDLQQLRASHCDLVVAIDRKRRQARLIGGNVADTVAMTLIPLTEDGRAVRTLSRAWYVLARPR